MECQRCGYLMDAFDKECPRCARDPAGAPPAFQQQPMKGGAVPPAVNLPRPTAMPSRQPMATPQMPMPPQGMQRPLPMQRLVIPSGMLLLSLKQVLGAAGGLLLLLGVFVPFLKIVIFSFSLWQFSGFLSDCIDIGKKVRSTMPATSPGASPFSSTPPSLPPPTHQGSLHGQLTGRDSEPSFPTPTDNEVLFLKYLALILIVLAIATIILALTRTYPGLWVTGGLALAILVGVLIKFLPLIDKCNTLVTRSLGQNPMMGTLKSVLPVQMLSIEWGGVLILLLGIGSILTAAALPTPAGE